MFLSFLFFFFLLLKSTNSNEISMVLQKNHLPVQESVVTIFLVVEYLPRCHVYVSAVDKECLYEIKQKIVLFLFFFLTKKSSHQNCWVSMLYDSL